MSGTTDYVMTKVEYPDSVEVGTPKGGKLKLYFNADNKEHSEKRLEVAKEILKKAVEGGE